MSAPLEVGATYRTMAGNEVVVHGDVPDRDGDVPVFFVEQAQYGTHPADLLVRVGPTPADRYAVHFDGDWVEQWCMTSEGAVTRALNFGGRVARFTFAEWIEQ